MVWTLVDSADGQRAGELGKGDKLTYINDAVYKSTLMISDFHTATFLAHFMSKSILGFYLPSNKPFGPSS